MPRFSTAQKQALVKKALLRDHSCSLRLFAEQHQVGHSTLHRWIQLSRDGQSLEPRATRANHASAAIKFSHVIATAKLDEEQTGIYCREKGIYCHDLQQWEQDFMADKSGAEHAKLKAELKKQKNIVKNLERDLRRKEKALAEASALLILKKKADAIWGVQEED